MNQDISANSATHVLIFHDRTKMYIPREVYQGIWEASQNGMKRVEFGDSIIALSSIAKLIPMEEYEKEYSDEKDRQESTVQRRESVSAIPDYIEQLWVSKIVSEKEWATFYSKNAAYFNLGRSGDNIRMGFCTPNPITNGKPTYEIAPPDCYKMTEDELRRMDAYCKANYVFPRPFDDAEDSHND